MFVKSVTDKNVKEQPMVVFGFELYMIICVFCSLPRFQNEVFKTGVIDASGPSVFGALMRLDRNLLTPRTNGTRSLRRQQNGLDCSGRP